MIVPSTPCNRTADQIAVVDSSLHNTVDDDGAPPRNETQVRICDPVLIAPAVLHVDCASSRPVQFSRKILP